MTPSFDLPRVRHSTPMSTTSSLPAKSGSKHDSHIAVAACPHRRRLEPTALLLFLLVRATAVGFATERDHTLLLDLQLDMPHSNTQSRGCHDQDRHPATTSQRHRRRQRRPPQTSTTGIFDLRSLSSQARLEWLPV
ncbi:hypothetical protein DEO72_LG3g959 [Vigna unguiculata]|uniref:Uncharacterized protein n=1 Tax=Vigna unguiculata TaxID=3917 RepID=A0A4D6LDF7_VIGUN|nr:hypothetical protein DEO72_LG3g959 [Vigna unguiculata]